jgi:hypothetical protein
MPNERRYECTLQAGPYRIKVNVVTSDESRVEELAKEKASKLLKRLHGVPEGLLEMEVDSIEDRTVSSGVIVH